MGDTKSPLKRYSLYSNIPRLTFLDLGLRCRQYSAGPYRLWREHSPPSRSTCDPNELVS
jgi:hypothetical protein